MNISRLAQQLKMTPNELLGMLPQLGFHVGRRALKVNDSEVDKIVEAVRRHQKLEALKDREQGVTEIRGKQGAAKKAERTVILPETIIVKDLAEMLKLPIAKVMAEMMRNGIMASLNERLDFDTASILSEDLGYTVTKAEAKHDEHEQESNKSKLDALLSSRVKLSTRPPVVVVMGHVDHGKTKLLDAIRKTNVMGGESGGITQHIGAYQVETTSKGVTRTITFLDTPGHEAFKAMRSRGGQIADVAILVVAADDGLKPQTLESIAIIQKEKLPFVVAINKIDKEAADIERVKKELTEINLTPEEWGGSTVIAQISALKGKGIQELLELVLLVVDMQELKADPSGTAVGTIIESHVDKGEGPVATALIQAGTLRKNDLMIVGSATGKVKTLKDWKGMEVTEATPGMPVKLLGLKQLPDVGEILTVETDRKEFTRQMKQQEKLAGSRRRSAATVTAESETDKNIPSINFIIRADVLGSLEALEDALMKLSTSTAAVRIVKRGLGFVTEADVLTAQATNASVISFHLKENRNIVSMAEERHVPILAYDVIYHALEQVKKQLEGIVKPKTVRELIGKLKLLKIFKTTGKTVVCGGKVTNGLVRKGAKIKILRGEEIITYGELKNLQSSRENVNEAVAPNEVGMEITCEPVLQEGDILEFFEEKK